MEGIGDPKVMVLFVKSKWKCVYDALNLINLIEREENDFLKNES